MASNLYNKVNSYALERGIEFNSTYPTTSPFIGPRTGTNPLGNWAKNTTGNIVWEPTVGPLGGAGSWKLQWSTTTATNSYVRGTTPYSTELLGCADDNWSVGFWFKINNVPPVSSSAAATLLQFNENAGGFTLSLQGNTAVGGKANLTVAKSAYGTITQLVNGGINTEQWYYFAFTREGTSHKIYLNGTMIFSFGSSGVWNTSGALMWGDTSARTFNGSWNISNYYLAPATVINQTQIQEIWTAGSTNTRTVKYFDGNNWQTSSAQKVWNGTAWIDWTAKKYDGTQWITI
jgi:hypothetical protein